MGFFNWLTGDDNPQQARNGDRLTRPTRSYYVYGYLNGRVVSRTFMVANDTEAKEVFKRRTGIEATDAEPR